MNIQPCALAEVDALCSKYHGYGGAGGVAVYCFGVFEAGDIVAAFAWQPPPPGAAKALCPDAPCGVLALSRMVAVPRLERALRHISKPLRFQMKRLIDRTRWPVLVTYSDEGQGHTGHVYKCSGWQKTARANRTTWTNASGVRVSSYRAGSSRDKQGLTRGTTTLQRWEHRVIPQGEELEYMTAQGWRSVATGSVWKSGNPAYRIERAKQ